ncbi:nicotinate phosphoribosyltransferase [Dyadobacter fermentans]|uniref:Nicotinate phosphoribosyltransferase n=1 Tax=Dyadobacter fermentans (strain ATCC 700827 / DSM 18053 / CIP 107007 / KCTC 52180 / NS114) TaxID=471854 RepID=C6W6Q1_DYAFD|nr:nicotinate phosphoribosyltransferase [Dyadobacter fermentans]ACT96112.1 nicotinate phosphoribosyltransferase [Dyadobacter fermentans DSM 18053]
MINQLYDTSMSLLTDLYQLTMAYGYWKAGKAEQEAVFNLYFRKHPFQGGFTIAAGLCSVIEYLQDYRFNEEDLTYIASLSGSDGDRLFDDGFIDYLRNMELQCSIDAIPEGTVVFPNEPLLRIQGPILQCQLLETPLLNLINFQSLVATKAARMRLVAGNDALLEFGLRRAQGPDGGVTASRAAYIGGFNATSNVLAGKLYDIPVKGTHAHSWVMSFDSELEAFETYAKYMPNNVTLLVDTYDSLNGVRHAVEVGKQLREAGHDLAGIRLDSGDLAYLSIEARKILDEAGFPKTSIVASNDLDEYIMDSLKIQGARINVWGIGTKLVTAYDQPALGGVFKLAAIRDESGGWDYKLKLSEQAIKVSTPGIQQVRRFRDSNGFVSDMIFNIETPPIGKATMVDPYDFTKNRSFGESVLYEDLLVPVFAKGRLIYKLPSVHNTRKRVQDQLAHFYKGIKRFVNPHTYPVGLEKDLFDLKTNLIFKLRAGNEA